MKIGIIGAMKQEIILLLNLISNYTLHQYGVCKIYTGQVYGINIVLMQSGIGKVFAALGTTLLITQYKSDLVINIGSAGGLLSLLKIGDIVAPNEVCYHDVNITAFGYAPGQVAECPVLFHSDPMLMALLKKIVNYLNIQVINGLIVSGDKFVRNNTDLSCIQKNFPQAVAVEMEAAAIAQVCYQFHIPFIIIRSISDIVKKESSYLNFQQFLSIAVQNSSLLVTEMVKMLAY